MAVSMIKHFWNGTEYADIAKIVYTSANFDSPAVAGTRSHAQPGGKYIATWYEAVDYMYRQKENQDYFNSRDSMESFFGLLELREDFDLDRDSSAQFKTDYSNNYYINDAIDYIYLDRDNYAKVGTSESFLTVSGISIDFIIPDHTNDLFFDKTNTIWWNSGGLNSDELLNVYISYNNGDWYLISDNVRNIGNFSFNIDYLKAKGFDSSSSNNQLELLPAEKVYRYIENDNNVLTSKGAATLSAIFVPGGSTTGVSFRYKPSAGGYSYEYTDEESTVGNEGTILTISEDVEDLIPGIEYEFQFVYYEGTVEKTDANQINSFTTTSYYQVYTNPYIVQTKLKITYLDAYEDISESFYMKQEEVSSATPPIHEITYSQEVQEVAYVEGTPYQPYVPPAGDRIDTEVNLATYSGICYTDHFVHYDEVMAKFYKCNSNKLYEFDVPLNKWVALANLPFDSVDVSFTTKLGNIYILNLLDREFYRYSIANDLWTKLSDFLQFTFDKLEIKSLSDSDDKLYALYLDGYNYMSGTEPAVKTYEDFDTFNVFEYSVVSDTWELFTSTSSPTSVGVSDSSLTEEDVLNVKTIEFDRGASAERVLLPNEELQLMPGDDFIGPIATYSGGVFRHESQGMYNFNYNNSMWNHDISSPMPSADALVSVGNSVYLVDNNYFYSFNTVTGVWEQLRDVDANCLAERGQELYYFSDTPDYIYLVSTEELNYWEEGELYRTRKMFPKMVLSCYKISTGYWDMLLTTDLQNDGAFGSIGTNSIVPGVLLFKDGTNTNYIYFLSLLTEATSNYQFQYIGVSYIDLLDNSVYNVGALNHDLESMITENTELTAANWRIDDCSSEYVNIGGGRIEYLIAVTQAYESMPATLIYTVDQEYQFIRGSFDASAVTIDFNNVASEMYNQDLGVISTTSGVVYSDTSMVNFRNTLGPIDIEVGSAANVIPRVIRTASDDEYVYMFACLEESSSYYSSNFCRVPFKSAIDADPNITDTIIDLPGTADVFNSFIFNSGDTLYSIGKESSVILTATLSGNDALSCTLSGGDFNQLGTQSVFGSITTSGGPYTFNDEVLSSCVYDEVSNKAYGVGGNDTYNFCEIDLTSVTYTPLADAPWLLKNNNTSCFLNSKVYVIQGPNSSAFASYSIALDSWTVLSSLPPELEVEYPILCSTDSTDYLYLINNKDPNVYVYSVVNDSWEIKEDILVDSRLVVPTEVGNYFKYYFSRYNRLYLFKYDESGSVTYPSAGYMLVVLDVSTMVIDIPTYDDAEYTWPNRLAIPGSDGYGDIFNSMIYNNNLVIVSAHDAAGNPYLFYTKLYQDPIVLKPYFVEYETVGNELLPPILFSANNDGYVYCITVYSDYISSGTSMGYKNILIRKVNAATNETQVLGTSGNKFSPSGPSVGSFSSWGRNVDISLVSGDIAQISSTKFELMLTYNNKGSAYGTYGLHDGACFRGVIDFSSDFLSFEFTPVHTDPFYYDMHKNFPIGLSEDSITNLTRVTTDNKFFYMSFLTCTQGVENSLFYRLPLKTTYDLGTVCSGTSLLPWYTDGSIYESSIVSTSGTNLYCLGGVGSSYLYSMDTSSEVDFSITWTGSSVFNQLSDLSEGPYIFDSAMMKNTVLDRDTETIYLLGDYFISVSILTNTTVELTYPYFYLTNSLSFVILNGNIYLTPGAPFNTVYKYNLVGDSWQEVAPFPASLVKDAVICTGDNIYFLYIFNSEDTNMYRYNVSNDSWLTVDNYFNSGEECPTITMKTSLYKDGHIYFEADGSLIKFNITNMVAERYFSYNYSTNSWPALVGNNIYTNTGNSLIRQLLDYTQSEAIDEVPEISEIEYVPYRAEIPYSPYEPATYSGSDYVIYSESPAEWQFSTDLTSPESVILNFNVNFSTVTGDGVVTSGTLMYHQFSGTAITEGSATPIDRYHCGENSILFEVTFGEAYNCRLTAWDDDTHSTTNNLILSGDHYRVDAAVYRIDTTSEAYNPLFISPRSLVYPPCSDKILKGNDSYYGDFDFIYAINTEDNGEFLAFIPRLEDIDETFVAGNYDFITTLHYEYT